MDEIKEVIKHVTSEMIMFYKYDMIMRNILKSSLHDAGCDDDFTTVLVHAFDIAYAMGKLDTSNNLYKMLNNNH